MSFVSRLHGLGRSALLAGVGDRIDFVVTLASEAATSTGRLERQTERGTVAIRELSAARCDDVAEALALSLELALEPTSAPIPAAAGASEANGAAPGNGALDRVSGAAAQPPPEPSPPEGEASRSGLRAGVLGGVATGIAPFVTPGASLFAELAEPIGSAAARLSAHAAYGRGDVQQTSLRVALLSARLDGCAFGWNTGALGVEPCIGSDIGMLRSSTTGQSGRADQGLWVTLTGLLRSRLQVSTSLALEADVGAVLPLLRYALGTPGGHDLFRTDAVGFDASFGISWRP